MKPWSYGYSWFDGGKSPIVDVFLNGFFDGLFLYLLKGVSLPHYKGFFLDLELCFVFVVVLVSALAFDDHEIVVLVVRRNSSWFLTVCHRLAGFLSLVSSFRL